MPLSAIEIYMAKLQKQHAMLRMTLGEAAKVPHMEEESRNQWAREIEEALNDGKPPVKVAPRVVLKMLGIGIKK